MLRNQQLAARIKEVFINGKWIANTNYKEQISDLTLQQALYKERNLNCIAALTFHINYYLNGLIEVLNGRALTISDQYSFDMPPLNEEKDWQNLCTNLLNNAQTFYLQVEQMNESLLDEIFVLEKYGTYQRNIEAIIEHSYYHLGQIVLIKKMIIDS